MVQALSEELGWELSPLELALYSQDLVQYAPEGCDDTVLRTTITTYHADHATVMALRDQRHPEHTSTWEAWMPRVLGMLHRAGLHWSDDGAFDADDLAQIARAELARSLDSYRYKSRFFTWAYRVVAQSVQRVIRDTQAAKRAGRPESLEHVAAEALPGGSADHSEEQVAAQELAALIAAILDQHGGPRLVAIFDYWALKALKPAEIGPLVQLHPSRVRALLQQARKLLRDHPAIQGWKDADPDGAHRL